MKKSNTAWRWPIFLLPLLMALIPTQLRAAYNDSNELSARDIVVESELNNGVPVTNLSGARGSESFYFAEVPAGTSMLTIKINGGTGDSDLFVLYNQKPTVSNYQCRPFTSNNNETCTINAPQAGKYYVMLRGYATYGGVTLTATY